MLRFILINRPISCSNLVYFNTSYVKVHLCFKIKFIISDSISIHLMLRFIKLQPFLLIQLLYISIHLMLRFIKVLQCISHCVHQNFNTSYVKVHLHHYAATYYICIISIHLMLRFIGKYTEIRK